VSRLRAYWTQCLRALDGETAGANGATIAEGLGLSDRDEAQALLDGAHQLCYGGYRALLLLPPT
jgi:hypothetical protein